MKPAFPKPAPAITLPEIPARLIADFDRYSSGSIPFGMTTAQVTNNETKEKIADIVVDPGCNVTVEKED